jgi:voltage-gated sodium channel
MVKALLASVPKMLCICFLLALQFYTFTIVFTDLFKDGCTSADYFGSLDMTCFTLIQIMTHDSWASITKEMMKAYNWAWLPFVLFIMSSTFFFLNLIIVVICEAVSNVDLITAEGQMQKLSR